MSGMTREFVWSIDPALSLLAFAFADVGSEGVEVETLITRTTEREGARLGLLDRQVRIYARQAAGRYPPANRSNLEPLSKVDATAFAP